MTFKITIASGKGGTGKTLLSVNLAFYFKHILKTDVALIDLDVEEPNSSIFLKGKPMQTFEATRMIPFYDRSLCTDCGICSDVCMFNALIKAKNHVLIYKNLCHSCNACVKLCPAGALSMKPSRIGEIHLINTNQGIQFIEGVLDIKEEMSTPLIGRTKDIADEMFRDTFLHIYDSPPGTSCSYIEAMKDTDLLLIITEPTPFGISDSTLAIETANILKKNCAVVLNRTGEENQEAVKHFENLHAKVIAQIKSDKRIAETYSTGDIVFGKYEGFDNAIKSIAEYVLMRSRI